MYRKILLSLLMIASIAAFAQGRKSVSVLGDSYSTYEGYIEPATNWTWYFTKPRVETTDVNDVKQTWWHQFIKNNGYKLEKNNSYSGSTVCYTGYDGADYTDISFVSRMDNLGNPDIIFIFGATNDSWANVPLGDLIYSGWTPETLKSFNPALTYMLDHMSNRYINTEIIYLINDGLNEELTDAIKEACDHYGIRYIALKDIDKTAGHPNQHGMTQIADQINQALKK